MNQKNPLSKPDGLDYLREEHGELVESAFALERYIARNSTLALEIEVFSWLLFSEEDPTEVWSEVRSKLAHEINKPISHLIFSTRSAMGFSLAVDEIWLGTFIPDGLTFINPKTIYDSIALSPQAQSLSGVAEDEVKHLINTLRDHWQTCDKSRKIFEFSLHTLSSRALRLVAARGVREIAARLAGFGSITTNSLIAQIEEVTSTCRQVGAGRMGEGAVVKVADVADKTWANYIEEQKVLIETGERSYVVYSTGFPGFDEQIIGGIRAIARAGARVRGTGRLLCVGGQTGHGKSTFLISASVNVAMQGGGVLYLTAEEPIEDIHDKLFSAWSIARLPRGERMKPYGEREKSLMPVTANSLCDIELEFRKESSFSHTRESFDILRGDFKSTLDNLSLSSVNGQSASRVAEIMIAAKSKRPEIALVVLDHLYNLGPEKGVSPHSNEDYIERMRVLDSAAKRCGVDILFAHQFRKESESKSFKKRDKGPTRPSKDLLYGSGAVSNYASSILLLWQHSECDARHLTCVSEKARRGTKQDFNLYRLGEFSYVMEV